MPGKTLYVDEKIVAYRRHYFSKDANLEHVSEFLKGNNTLKIEKSVILESSIVPIKEDKKVYYNNIPFNINREYLLNCIADETCAEFCIKFQQLVGRERIPVFVDARRAFYYVAKKFHFENKEIMLHINRHRTDSYHYEKTTSIFFEVDKNFKKKVLEILKNTSERWTQKTFHQLSNALEGKKEQIKMAKIT